ncbi:bZIP transcription factor 11-like [Phalaenopsis equestris]|uniref:bZIP transcription factor 11-like n=1 Tax=Phalaenopsis equestris TaxID=78828 RepID=UPI0009E1DD64|nr:bZIP transcription factor 11-like [Phalaenopsis equestris]
MAQRKEKRMLSNRESARRSRMRKQKYLNDLMLQVSCLRQEKDEIFTAINATSQRHIGVEAQNCLLRAQLTELIKRLQCLRHIIHCMNVADAGDGGGRGCVGFASCLPDAEDDSLLRPWTSLHIKQGLQGSDVF